MPAICSAIGILPENAVRAGDASADMNAGGSARRFTIWLVCPEM